MIKISGFIKKQKILIIINLIGNRKQNPTKSYTKIIKYYIEATSLIQLVWIRWYIYDKIFINYILVF